MTTSLTKPLRILYVENGIGYGGAIICLRYLAGGINRADYQPIIVTGRSGPEYAGIRVDATWVHIQDRHFDTAGARKRLGSVTWPDLIPGLRFILLQVIARLDDVANFLPFFVRLFTFVIFNDIALIHANNEPVCNRAALIVGRLLRIPTVCHVRDSLSGSSYRKWLFGLPDHFIPVSEWVSERLGKLGIPEHRRTVTYDGIPLERLDLNVDAAPFRAKYRIPPDAFAVGLVGLLIPWKGQDLFLDAAKVLKESIPGLKMLIIGGTPDDCISYEHHLRSRVESEGLSDLIVFTGHIANMPQVYRGLDVVVSASTSPEPLGTVVIEAMTMARALVAPGHGGAAEMTKNGISSLLFEPGSAAGLTESIILLHREPQLRNRLGREARKVALDAFAVDRHVRDVAGIYRQVLASRVHRGN